MSLNAGTVRAEIILDANKYEKDLQKAEQQLNNFGKGTKSIGDNLKTFAGVLNKYVSLPLAAIGGIATKASIDFESAFAGVKKTVDATDKQLEVLKKGIRNMSKEIPASATAIAEVAEAAGQLGIKTENILGFTRVMIDLGESTNLSANDAATALARLANITGMSQTDFDRLGSTIVALGNNLATTESDIVAMGLRLAGAGKQIGLSEAQIMSFSGALSSVGIEAEAGGSAFSRLMVDMQLATEIGGKNLNNFAKVAGMSATEFKKAFQEDAAGAIMQFIKGLSESEEQGKSAINVLDELGITEIRLRDTLLRLAGGYDVLEESMKIGTNAWKENNALTNEAKQRYETTASKLQIFKNKLTDVAITLGDKVLPYFTDLIEVAGKIIDKFAEMDDKTAGFIVKAGALAIVLGSIISGGMKLFDTLKTVIGIIGTFKTAMAATTAATSATTTAVGATTLSLGAMGKVGAAVGLLLNPVGITIAGLATAGVIAAKKLSEDALPAVELFGEGVSETAQKSINDFMELENKATVTFNQIAWSGQEMTKKMAEEVGANFTEMKNVVINQLNTQKEEKLTIMQEMVANAETLSEEEKNKMLEMTETMYSERIEKVQEGEQRILEILDNAAKEGRKITEDEQKEINRIKNEMREEGVKILSEGEKEQLVILNRLKEESTKISAHQAAEVVRNSKKQKEETIKQAEEEYNERLKIAAELRYQGGKEAEELANKIEKEAKRQYNETVSNAEQMHKDVVKEAKAQAKEHVHEVDWETGEVKTKWQVAVSSVVEGFREWRKNVGEHIKYIKDDIIGKGNKQAAENLQKKWDETCRKVGNIWDNFSQKANSTWDKVGNAVDKAIKKVRDWNNLKVKDKIATFTQKIRTIGDKLLSSIGFNYTGTDYWRGGLTWVGERGPELISLPRGTKIYNNVESERIAKNTENTGFEGIVTLQIPLEIDGREVAKATAKFTSRELNNLLQEGMRG
jgi:TP901 family phage tail tape measure protein